MTDQQMSDRPSQVQPSEGNHHHDGLAPAPPDAHPFEGRSTMSRSMLTLIGVVIALVAGVAAGVMWRGPIVAALGLHAHGSVEQAGGKKLLWTCGMHPQVIQDKPGLCPICQMKLEPLDLVQSGQSSMTGGGGKLERKIAYWWDPMLNPPYISDRPGKSPMGMDLVPRYEDELTAGAAVKIDPVVVQNMGVRVAEVTRGPVRRVIRAVGYLDEAQPLVHDVNLRVSGWVEKLHADTEGKHLVKGDPLFDLYSPEVQVGVEELVAAGKAARSTGAGTDELSRQTAQALLEAARRKLVQWGLEEQEVNRLAALERAPRTVTFTSPITGHVTEKMIVQGASVKAGDKVLQIVDHSTLWLDAQVHAQDLPFVRLGQPATAEVEGFAGTPYSGEIVFLHPHVDPSTRTATARMSVPNPDMKLRPGMYATARVEAQLQDDALLVPREAVIDTGTRQIVFLVAGEGHFEPRLVKVGSSSADGMVQLLDGLAAGDRVVTSGQFLLDAESRMREAIQKHLKDRLLASAGGRGRDTPATAASHETHASGSAVPTTTTASARPPEADRAAPAAIAEAGQTPAVEAPALGGIDAIYREYLRIQQVMGGIQKGTTPLNVEELVQDARRASETATNKPQHPATLVADAAAAMQGRTIDEQRRLYGRLSDAVIALADVAPPTKTVADRLYVAYCPMAFDNKGGQWLQAAETIENPFYAAEMKHCGVVKRKIEARDGGMQ